MTEVITYKDSDLWIVIGKMINLEDMVVGASVKTKKSVTVDSEIKYFIEDDQWEGVVIVDDAEKSR